MQKVYRCDCGGIELEVLRSGRLRILSTIVAVRYRVQSPSTAKICMSSKRLLEAIFAEVRLVQYFSSRWRSKSSRAWAQKSAAGRTLRTMRLSL